MRINYLYSHSDGRRARLVYIDNGRVNHARLIIRAEAGQGAVLLNKVYTTRRGARAALTRRGGAWTCIARHTY